MLKRLFIFVIVSGLFFSLQAQIKDRTKIRGFMHVEGQYNDGNDETDFSLGEQDLFITSDITDKISFLGESVFKFSSTSSSKFTVGLERAVLKYNYKGNHSFVAGKFHTPVNYWNDSYHHGRLFFPTAWRPELFNKKIIPIHMTGMGLQGANLTKLKFGYNLMVGNGRGSTDVADDNKEKSYVIAVHAKPINGFRVGVSAYLDEITQNDSVNINQALYSGSLAYFKGKFEFLVEGTYGLNGTDSIADQVTLAGYAYVGFRIKDMIIPYFRADYLQYDDQEMYFNGAKTNTYVGGIRYEISYLSVVKLEFQHTKVEGSDKLNRVILQFAVGF
jgi:hypothetical protein